MKIAIVSTADIAAQPGAPLHAAYWAERNEGESHQDWQRRKDAAAQLRLAQRHIDRATAALSRAAALQEAGHDRARP
jgi:hypothetical protein